MKSIDNLDTWKVLIIRESADTTKILILEKYCYLESKKAWKVLTLESVNTFHGSKLSVVFKYQDFSRRNTILFKYWYFSSIDTLNTRKL